jgi:hypothetical protein
LSLVKKFLAASIAYGIEAFRGTMVAIFLLFPLC